MPTITRQCTHVCEIDRAAPNQANANSCDVGKYTGTTNNCFFNFVSLNAAIPPGSTITNASLKVAQVSGGFTAAITSKVSLRLGNWGAFTWNVGPYLACDGNQFSLSGSSAGTRTINVTNIVQWIVDNNSPHHIFRFERIPNDQTGTSDAKRFSTTAANHSIEITYTAPPAPSAPHSLGASPNPCESSLLLEWTRGTGDASNPITGQDVCYSTSMNGTSWSAETVVATPAGLWLYPIPTVTVSGWARGLYIRFRVGAKSAHSATVYSAYSTSYRKNREPGTPTGAYTAYSSYIPGDTIRVLFAHGGDPDNNLAGCEVAMQNAAGVWHNGGEIMGTNPGSSSTFVDVNTTGWAHGNQWKFLVRAYDALGVRGAWSAPTALITMNTAPLAPSIGFPAAGSTVFNRRPRILLTAAPINDGTKHIAEVRAARGVWLSTATSGSLFSCGTNDDLAGSRKLVFQSDTPDDAPLGSNTVTARMFDSYLHSTEVSRQFSVAALSFTNANLGAANMKVRAVHVTELQAAIGTLRAAYGLPPVAWKAVTPNVTKIGDDSIVTQMQSAVQEVINLINGWDSATAALDISVSWVAVTVAGGVSGAKLRQGIEQLRSILPTI